MPEFIRVKGEGNEDLVIKASSIVWFGSDDSKITTLFIEGGKSFNILDTVDSVYYMLLAR